MRGHRHKTKSGYSIRKSHCRKDDLQIQAERVFRQAFKLWRQKTGMSLREVQKCTKISNGFLNDFEQGRVGMSQRKSDKLLDLMENLETITIYKYKKWKVLREGVK